MPTILDTAVSITGTTTFPTISAGTNRVALLFIANDNQTVGSNTHTAVTLGGQPMSKITGTPETPVDGYVVSSEWWMLNEAGIGLMADNELVLTGGDSAPSLTAITLSDAAQTVPLVTGSLHQNYIKTGTVTLAAPAAGLILLGHMIDVTGNSSSFSTSSVTVNTLLVNSDKNDALTVAYSDITTAESVDLSFTNAFQRDNATSAFFIGDFEPATISIINIDGDNAVYPGQSTDITTDSGADSVHKVTLGGVEQNIEVGATSITIPITIGYSLPYGTYDLTVERLK